MKLFGLIAIVVLTFSACQKENLRPDCPKDRTENTDNSAATTRGASVNPTTTRTTVGASGSGPVSENEGGGIVDPNADQDANTAKQPKKGK